MAGFPQSIKDPLSISPIVGQFYRPPGTNKGGSVVQTLNRLYALPFFLKTQAILNSINVLPFAGIATALLRVGIYNDDGNGNCGSLLLDAGQIDVSTSGAVLSITNLNLPVGPGTIWPASCSQVAAANMMSCESEIAVVNQAIGRLMGCFNQNAVSIQDGVTGGLPPVFTTSGVNTSGTNPGAPIIVLGF